MGDHAQRYEFAAERVAGKRVLDIACGVGYGSRILADANAQEVLGIDRSAEAIAEANQRFFADCVRFRQSTAETLYDSLDGFTPEVIVSFETLEHLPQQADFVRSLRRVLGEQGCLFISTPNVEARSPEEREKPSNPFHTKELTRGEFLEILQQNFQTVEMLGQWQTWDCKLRLAQEKERFQLLCELYWNPTIRLGRMLRRVFGKSSIRPRRYGAGDNFSWDYEIRALDSNPYPWPASTLLAVCQP